MIGSALARSLKSKNWNKTLDTLPVEFTLNSGHVKFFYNKGKYIHKRYDSLVEEMKRRGMNPDPERKFKTFQWPDYLYRDWDPTDKDLELVRERIRERIQAKPEWYRWSNK